jgi:transposase
MWLLKRLWPAHKTIADVRKHNLQPLRQVCRECTLLCKQLDLCAGELVAIDGSKFKAVNAKACNFTPDKLTNLLPLLSAKLIRGTGDIRQAIR